MIPYGNISSSIPHSLRRRVWVKSLGYGWTQDRITLGGVLVGVGVMMEDAALGHMIVLPVDIVAAPEPVIGGRDNVVRGPWVARVRAVEAGV